jgi:hypothetical protein
MFVSKVRSTLGHAVVELVSRRFPTTAARVRARVRSCGISDGQSGTGAGFLRVLRFPLPILIPPTATHSSSIIRGWYKWPISGRRTKWTQSYPTPRNQQKRTKSSTRLLLWKLCLSEGAHCRVLFPCFYSSQLSYVLAFIHLTISVGRSSEVG